MDQYEITLSLLTKGARAIQNATGQRWPYGRKDRFGPFFGSFFSGEKMNKD